MIEKSYSNSRKKQQNFKLYVPTKTNLNTVPRIRSDKIKLKETTDMHIK